MHFRERRIFRNVVRSEDDELTKVLRDGVARWLLSEEPLTTLLADMLHLLFTVEAGARMSQRSGVHIGGQDFNVQLPLCRRKLLVQNHRQRVWLFSGGAAGHPDANLIALGDSLENLGEDILFEKVEDLRIPEKPGDSDKKVEVKGIEFVRIDAQPLHIIREVHRTQQFNPAQDPPADCSCLVQGKVEIELVAQKPQHRFHGGFVDDRLRFGFDLPVGVKGQEMRNIFGGCSAVHHTGRQCAQRHSIEVGALRAFHEYVAAGSLDIAYAARSVAAAPRKDYRYAVGPQIPGKRPEEEIDRQRKPMSAFLVIQKEPPVLDDHLLPGREEIDVVGLNLDLMLRELDGHVGMPG